MLFDPFSTKVWGAVEMKMQRTCLERFNLNVALFASVSQGLGAELGQMIDLFLVRRASPWGY